MSLMPVTLFADGRAWTLFEAAWDGRVALVVALLAAGARADATLGEAFGTHEITLDLVTATHLGGPRPGYGPETDALDLALHGGYSLAYAEVVTTLLDAGARVRAIHHDTLRAESIVTNDGGYARICEAIARATPGSVTQ